jgi:hypothetical protein
VSTARPINRLLLTRPDHLEAAEREQLAQIRAGCPHIVGHIAAFAQMMDGLTGAAHLDPWLAAVEAADGQPEHHRLARLPSVLLADLADEAIPRWPGQPGSAGDGPAVRDAGQLMQLIALGRMVVVVPESVRSLLYAGLTCRPVTDAPTATIVVAWPSGSTSRHVAAFVRAATAAAQRRGRLSSAATAAPD